MLSDALLFMWTSYFSSFSTPVVTRPHDNHNDQDGDVDDNLSLHVHGTKPRLAQWVVPGSRSTVWASILWAQCSHLSLGPGASLSLPWIQGFSQGTLGSDCPGP